MKHWFLTPLALVLLAAVTLGLTRVDSAVAQDRPKPIRVLLVIGGCCHDYKKQQDILTKGISARAHVEFVVSYDPDTGVKHLNPVYEKPDWSTGFDVVIHDECCSGVDDPVLVNRILEPHRLGLPAVVLHCGMHSYRTKGYPKSTPWFEFTGLPSTGHGPQLPIAVTYVDKDSPITRGLANWTTVNEELYNNSQGKLLDTAKPLARGVQGKDDYVVAWTNTYVGKTRVFATTLGHNNATVADARYLDLVTRGLLWSVDKLNDTYLKKQ